MDLLLPQFGLIFWTTIVFLLVLFLLSKYAWKPIINAVRERENSIDEALRTAEKVKEEMAALSADNEKLLQKAREERSKILKAAKENADKIVADAIEKASDAARKLAADAKQDIDNQKQAAIAELKIQSGKLALNIASKLLQKELAGQAEQESYMKKLIEDLDFNQN